MKLDEVKLLRSSLENSNLTVHDYFVNVFVVVILVLCFCTVHYQSIQVGKFLSKISKFNKIITLLPNTTNTTNTQLTLGIPNQKPSFLVTKLLRPFILLP